MITTLVLLALFIWIATLSFFVGRTIYHYSRLTGKTDKGDLRVVLEQVLKEGEETARKISEVERAVLEIVRDGERHFQKRGVVRFNPFNDTGGNQSFALALLDKKDSGVLVLSLHGRSSTRVYVKEVENGESRYELSKEEKQAIEKAQRIWTKRR